MMWGAFAERMNREQTSPVKTFELNAMPEKRSSRRTPSASSTDGERERPSVARSIERELLEDMTGESASAPEIVTSPEPMAVDSPGEDSDASESMRVTPPPSKFSMGASGASGSGTRKSASFRSNASPLRVEIRTESTEAETPASTKSEEFTLRASPTSPVVSPAEAKKFTFNAPPSKSPSVMRKVRSPDASNEAGGIFKMGTDGVQPTPKPRSNNRYAQRAGSIRRTVSGGTPTTPTVSEVEELTSKITLDKCDLEQTEKLRQEGNELYGKGLYAEADELYSRAIMQFAAAPRTNAGFDKDNESPLGHAIDIFVGRDAAVLLTNRAAARMMIPTDSTPDDERRTFLLKALTDCERATRADPTYLRARVRLSSCHMKLGDFTAALQCLEDSPSSDDIEMEHVKVEAKAANENLNKVLSSALALGTCQPGLPRLYNDIRARVLNDTHTGIVRSVSALAHYPLISSGENGKAFIEAKATLYIVCGAYQEASDFVAEIDRLGLTSDSWVPDFVFMSKFGQGDPLSACQYAEGLEKCDIDVEMLAMARAMLNGKDEGNKLFNAKEYTEAVVAYTKAFEFGTQPIAAAYCSVILGNRAAAYQGLNEYLNALADCGRALSFNPWNIKALSRRATLHESIRCWEDAIDDLRSYIEIAGNAQYSLFSTERERKDALAMATDRLRRLETIKDTQRNSQVDMYRILGLEDLKENASAADIKKAYRNLALKYHPDKANRSMPAWAPAHELHDDADRLFKLLGETNANLSDPALRRVYDETERIRSHGDNARYTRSSSWSSASTNDFQYGHDAAAWMSSPPRRSRNSRMNRNQSTGKNYYWNY